VHIEDPRHELDADPGRLHERVVRPGELVVERALAQKSPAICEVWIASRKPSR
jgi:hypothetical protein